MKEVKLVIKDGIYPNTMNLTVFMDAEHCYPVVLCNIDAGKSSPIRLDWDDTLKLSEALLKVIRERANHA